MLSQKLISLFKINLKIQFKFKYHLSTFFYLKIGHEKFVIILYNKRNLMSSQNSIIKSFLLNSFKITQKKRQI